VEIPAVPIRQELIAWQDPKVKPKIWARHSRNALFEAALANTSCGSYDTSKGKQLKMIQFKNLVKRFGTRTVLNGLSLTIQEGEIVFILGTSGTGKSVLLKNMVGLLSPDEGEIWIDGEKVSAFTEQEYFAVRKKCGMVFQHPALFDSLSIFENIAFGLRRHFNLSETEIKSRVEQALKLVHLGDIQSKRPAQISYGMQKRVSLARTVALFPKILLFDEPTTGLDPVTTTAINELILNLSRELKTTSVVVSHDMNCALAIADRIVVLDQGGIAAQGTPSELKKSNHPLVKDFLAEVLA
jgi:phospholipid/cholesterol/gamma-HCH transport system ATP-binding protein